MTVAASGEDSQAPPAARRRHDPRRERTPQRLIAAARIVFERDGFHDARLSDVTREAKVSTGTLYNYFDSKTALFRAVMQGVLDDLTAKVAELIDRHPGARLERKRAAVAVHTRGLPEDDAEAALREAAALGEGRTDVRTLRGKSVVELSVSHADKGTAIAALGREK